MWGLTISDTVLAAIITVFGGALVKILYETFQAKHKQSLVVQLLEKQEERTKARDKLQSELDDAKEAKQRAFDMYDAACKTLEIAHARSYITGNNVDKLKGALNAAVCEKGKFDTANSQYYQELQTINTKLLEMDEG